MLEFDLVLIFNFDGILFFKVKDDGVVGVGVVIFNVFIGCYYVFVVVK